MSEPTEHEKLDQEIAAEYAKGKAAYEAHRQELREEGDVSREIRKIILLENLCHLQGQLLAGLAQIATDLRTWRQQDKQQIVKPF
jgi:hypothetical protein